jgi:hypothetical protein
VRVQEVQTGVPQQYPYGVVGQQQIAYYYGVVGHQEQQQQFAYGQLPLPLSYGVLGGDMTSYTLGDADACSASSPPASLPMPMPMPASPLPSHLPMHMPASPPASLPLPLPASLASPTNNKRRRNPMASPVKRADPHVAHVPGTVIPPFPLVRAGPCAPAEWIAGAVVAVHFETG